MALIHITEPASEPVTLEETKEHIHVDADDEDARIADFIRTATRHLDGRDGKLGRCLIAQTWEIVYDAFPSGPLQVPLPQLIDVESVKYSDPTTGLSTTLPATDYEVDSASEPGWIVPAASTKWPSTMPTINAVRVRFVAGFGTEPEDVPEPLRTAIKMHVGHLLENRESVTFGSGFIKETPHGYEDLIRDYRVWAF